MTLTAWLALILTGLLAHYFRERRLVHVGRGVVAALLCASCKVGALVDSAPPNLGDAKRLAFVAQPGNTTAGAPITMKVTALDSAGSVVSVFNGRVTLSLAANPGGDQLHGTVTVTAVEGTATFTDVRVDRAASGYTITAHIDGLTDATSTAFDVAAGPAVAAVYIDQPTSTTPGSDITPAVQVQIVDGFGNAVAAYSGTVTVSLTHDGSALKDASLQGTTTVSATSGVASFGDLHIDQTGLGYTLGVSVPSGSTPAVSQPFDVVPL